MAVKGATAKTVVIEKLKQIFGNDFVAVNDGKVYVLANDGTEKVQICISMTCPKVPFGTAVETPAPTATEAVSNFQPAQIDETELNNVRKLIAEFGL